MATREEREAAREQLSSYTEQLMAVKTSEALLKVSAWLGVMARG